MLGIERTLVGGECPYWGCIPSKMMVRAANALAEASRVGTLAGIAEVTADWTPVAKRVRQATAGWDDQIAVHVKGAFNMCKSALPVMVERQYGRVINTSSASAFGGVGFAAYSTAKAALLGFTYALAAEYWRHGITVNVIAPDAATPHRLVEGAMWMERVASRGFTPPGAGASPAATSLTVMAAVSDDSALRVAASTPSTLSGWSAAAAGIKICSPFAHRATRSEKSRAGASAAARMIELLPRI